MSTRVELANCVRDLYNKGLTTSISGNHSIKLSKSWMLITPSGIHRYKLKPEDLIKINLETNEFFGKHQPSTEWIMHKNIYEKTEKTAIVHTHSPYTLGISISSKFQHIIEEAVIVVGVPKIIDNIPAGTEALANRVSECFRDNNIRVVIIRNHGVVAAGDNIHHARAIVESLEEWSKILMVSRLFGGPKYTL